MASSADVIKKSEGKGADAIELSIPLRYAIVPSIAAATGFSIGLIRGSRAASLQFLAENAHRAPTTLQGWYFYRKTKNYRMMLGGLRRGGVEGTRLGGIGMVYAVLEGLFEWAGVDAVREGCAGVSTGVLVGLAGGLRGPVLSRAVVVGGLVGLGISGLRLGRDRLREG